MTSAFEAVCAWRYVIDSQSVVGLNAPTADTPPHLSLFRAGAPERVLAPADSIIAVLSD